LELALEPKVDPFWMDESPVSINVNQMLWMEKGKSKPVCQLAVSHLCVTKSLCTVHTAPWNSQSLCPHLKHEICDIDDVAVLYDLLYAVLHDL
jgi:hypothetical protein